MAGFIIRRLLLALPVILGATAIVFFSIRLVPGDVIDAQISGSAWLSQEQQAQMRSDLGIDKPAITQFFVYLADLAQGDLGRSFRTGDAAHVEIIERMSLSIELAALSVVFSILLAIPIGIIAALYRDKWFDYLVRTLSVLGVAVPHFVLASIVVVFSAAWFDYAAPLGYSDFFDSPSKNLQQVLPAAIVLGIGQSAISMRLVRSMMLEVLQEDYMRTARAKGLSSRTVLLTHGLRNALIPVVTVWGTSFGYLLGGQVIVEHIFRLPGVGSLIVESLGQRDYPVLQACVLFMAIAFSAVNLGIDVLYGYLDPRVRYAAAKASA